MTIDERDELVRDLERACVRVEAVELLPWHGGEWQVRCWCPDPAHFYTTTNAARFREAVHNGLIPEAPRRALD